MSPAAGSQKDKKTAKDQDTIQLHADLVIVNATVTDAEGNYAHGLTARDFSITEDSKVQPIDSFAAEEAPFAAAILLDTSESMEAKFGLARGSAAGFLEQIRDDDQVAIYTFSEKVRQLQEFSNSKLVTDYIWDLKAEKKTRLYDCMGEAIEALADRQERRRGVLLISDGADTNSSRSTRESVLKAALRAGITVYTIDLIDDNWVLGTSSAAMEFQRGRRELRELAAQTGGLYVHSPHGEKVESGFSIIVEELRNQYTLTYYSSNQKRDGGWRAIAVTVSRPGLTVRTRKGYWGPKR
jgi:Ca-activated chloride channel family protein